MTVLSIVLCNILGSSQLEVAMAETRL